MISNKKLLKSIFSFVVFKYLSFGVGIIGQIYIARLLLPMEFSNYVIAVSIVEILFFISSIGLNVSILKYQNEKLVFETGLIISIGLGGVLLLLSLLGYFFIPYDNEIKKFFILLAFSKFLYLPLNVYMAYFEKDFKQFVIGIIELFAKIISFIISIYVIKVYLFKAEALVLKDILYVSIQFTIFFILVGKYIKFKLNKNILKKFFNFSSNILFLRVFEIINKQLPILGLGYFSKPYSALFERPLYLVGLPNTLFSPLNAKISYAFYSKFQNNNEKIKTAINLNFYVTIRLVLPIFIFVYFNTDFIIKELLGENWLSASDFLKGLSFVILFQPLFAIMKYYTVFKENFSVLYKAEIMSIISLVIGFFYIYVNNNYSIITYYFSFGYFIRFTFLFYKYKDLFSSYLKLFSPVIYILIIYFYLSFSNINMLYKWIIFLMCYIFFILIIEFKELKKIKRLISDSK